MWDILFILSIIVSILGIDTSTSYSSCLYQKSLWVFTKQNFKIFLPIISFCIVYKSCYSFDFSVCLEAHSVSYRGVPAGNKGSAQVNGLMTHLNLEILLTSQNDGRRQNILTLVVTLNVPSQFSFVGKGITCVQRLGPYVVFFLLQKA